MEEVNFVETTAEELEAAQVKKPRKKAKIEAVVDPAIEEVVPEKKPELKHGVVTYCNAYTGTLGFTCEGVSYQIPRGELAYKIGDKINFMIVDGKVVLGVE